MTHTQHAPAQPFLMHSYDALHLALFSGKGGVGKTTLSCGFARHWAKQFPDQKILLISTDPAHSLGDVLKLEVDNEAKSLPDLANLSVRALDAETLLEEFKERYGKTLELLVERGSFVEGKDLAPVWDLSWPGLDELMAILEIQRLLKEENIDRIVVDMAPSGHTLNLFGLMDFLDNFLEALSLFQEKHRVIQRSFTKRDIEDEADAFIAMMKQDLASSRRLLQNPVHTACLVVAIAEPMSFLETQRFLVALEDLKIPRGGLFVNRILAENNDLDRYQEQEALIKQFIILAEKRPLFLVPQQAKEPIGSEALDTIMADIQLPQISPIALHPKATLIHWPQKVLPGFPDFLSEGYRLIILGGKGGVGKTTVAASIAWGIAQSHPDKKIRAISIDPAHSLGDALGQKLSHEPTAITNNLSAQEVDSKAILEKFRQDYLWELAEMMSGGKDTGGVTIAYGPQAWRTIVSQALPGIDEVLALVTVMELLEKQEQDLIVLDTAPTGHLLRFLEIPNALGDWLGWIFKLWMKYQDVLDYTDLMSRLRTLRQQVLRVQKNLKANNHTEFISVFQAQAVILAETKRLIETVDKLNISQRYTVHNRYQEQVPGDPQFFPQQTIIHLPELPRSIAPLARIQGAANLLFENMGERVR
jgi:arsenite/tail-anchored protein-transporting ATPase